MRPTILLCLTLLGASPSPGQPRGPSPQEKDYALLIRHYEGMFSFAKPTAGTLHFGDTALKVEQRALRDLEAKLRPIVGAFTVPGFKQPGVMGNDDLFIGEAISGGLDALEYRLEGDSASGRETVAIVTTDAILTDWLLRRRSDIAPDITLDGSVAKNNFLTWAFGRDAAAVPYAQIPHDTLRSLGLSWGWMGAFEQDDCACAARDAVFMMHRGSQVVIVSLEIAHPIAPSPACVAASKPAREGEVDRGENFRSCYGREAVRDPQFGIVVSQIREMTSRIRRP